MLFSCAEIVAPPGGLPDKTAPTILTSVPENGALHVPSGNVIEIFFSERMTRPTSDGVVFISPAQSEKPTFRWSSDRLTIQLADSFLPNQTYAVLLQSGLTDLRGNSIDTGSVIAFSTGAQIEQGRISGQVMRDRKAETGALVALYPEEDSALVGSTAPQYLLTSGAGGQFVFRYLPEKAFRLIAFVDQNRDKVLDFSREAYAIADRPTDLFRNERIDGLLLELHRLDTIVPQIASASMNPDNLLQVNLSRPIFPDSLAVPAVRLKRSDNPAEVKTGEWCGAGDSAAAKLLFDVDAVDSGLYQISVLLDGEAREIARDSILLRSVSDQTPPRLVRVVPASHEQFADSLKEIRLQFSEPIQLVHRDSLAAELSLGGLPDTTIQIRQRGCELVVQSEQLLTGSRYRLTVFGARIRDRSGLPLADSLASFDYVTYHPDSLGSVSGEVLRSDSTSAPLVLTWTRVADRKSFGITLLSSGWTMQLPAGKYLVSGFLDLNGNRIADPGRLFPWTLAEPKYLWTDTITVRQRFETSNVRLSLISK